jgi:xylulokinase
MIYLGFDCSTQSFSAVALEIETGERRVRCRHSLNFDREFPAYGTTNGVNRGSDPREVWSSPAMWAEALDRMMSIVSEALGPDTSRIAAIAGSAQQHGSVYLTAAAPARWAALDPGRPLAPQLDGTFARDVSPVWMDESTSEQCAAIEAALGGPENVSRLTGSRAYERFTGPQIRKFHERQPDAWARTARVHLVSSFLASLLAGGDVPIDPGDGAGMNLMDIQTFTWSPAALEATAPGLAETLPPIRPSWTVAGPLSPYWQRRHGLPPAAVVAWSGDNPCSLVGTGAIDAGRFTISLGTSDTVFAWTPEPGAGASHVFGSPTGGYMNLVCFKNGSLARERVRDRYGLDWDGFSQALLRTPAGNGGALMLPWFEPEITPHVQVRGVRCVGLEEDEADRNVRAVVEGQAMAMANHSAAIAGGRVDRIVATGGGSANRAVLQVLADVFGADVYPLDITNTACLGAALRAFHAHQRAMGRDVPWTEVVRGFTEPRAEDRVAPIPAHVDVYRRLRTRYAGFEREGRS